MVSVETMGFHDLTKNIGDYDGGDGGGDDNGTKNDGDNDQ